MTKFSSNRLHFVEVDDTQAVDRPEDIKSGVYYARRSN